MPVRTACPSCQTPYTLADALCGKKVRCKECQYVFEVSDAASGVRAADRPPRAVPPPLPVEEADGGIVTPSLRAPAARAPMVAELVEDEGDRPVRGGRPRAARRPKRSVMPWVIAGSLGGVVLIAGVVILILVLAGSGGEEPQQAAG